MKFTIESIKDLKVKVKEMNGTLLSYYTQSEFKPDNSFRLTTEQSDDPIADEELVAKMISSFKENDEYEAGKLLYENLKLNPRQASDIRYWTYHNHYTFYKYIAKRWSDLWNKKKAVANPSAYILNHWIQSNSSQGELIDYPISGLWWAFYITDDENRPDRYELTKLFFQNLSLRTKLLGAARVGRHKPAVLAILEFIKEKKIPLEEATRAIVPYINLLGGIRPLSYFDKDWFKNKLENRFGAQIQSGTKLFIRPNNIIANNQISSLSNPRVINKQAEKFAHFLCLDAASGNYMISSKPVNNWDYCIGLDFTIQNQYLIHFYKEGKIKKTKINGTLSNKKVDRPKPYKNGICPILSLCDIQLILQPVLFGIAYKTKKGIFFKSMDEQETENFRTDNPALNQEGKKVLYLDQPFQSAFKILPHEIKDALGELVQKSPTSLGSEINNKYHAEKWTLLKNYWPELFDGSIDWN